MRIQKIRNAFVPFLLAALASLPVRLWGQAPDAAGKAAPAGPLLTLVERGQSLTPIVVFKDAPPYTRRAADELAAYIEKVSGAKPAVIEGCPDPLPAHAIWVGFQPVLTNLFPGIDFDFKHPEEVLIAANGNHLVIAGRDRWDPQRLTMQGRNSVIEGWQQEYGTINAVYTFLQEHLDVRWLWPGAIGEDIVKRDTIALAPFEYRYHPGIRLRSGILRYSAPGDGRGISHDWVRFQRLQLDSSHAAHDLLDTIGGHGYGDWWDRFNKTHPDYFALQPDGTRSGFPEPHTAKMCDSNPRVWNQWLDDVGELAKREPDRIIFNASPNDSYHRGHCVCTNCRAWDHPDGELLLFVWQGIAQEYVALSDRHVTLANQLGRGLKARFPGKDYFVLMFAYGNSRPPPVKAVPDDNVIMCSVANFHLRGKEAQEQHRPQFEGWGKVSKHLMWRPNLGNAYGWHWGWPAGSTALAIKDMQLMGRLGCMGIYFDSTWEHWSTQGPHYYLLAQMAWNPARDGQAVLEDYFRRGFGPAAADMKAYWVLLDGVRDGLASEALADMAQAYKDQKVFERATEHLDRATTALEGAPAIYRQRVDFVRAGLDFTRLTMEIRDLVGRYQKSKGEDTAARDQAEARWAEVERIRKAQPLAIHWLRVGRGNAKASPMPATFEAGVPAATKGKKR